MYVKHQMIEPDTIEQRLYQEAIASSAIERSTLVVLPTGIGKTVIALMVMAETLRTKKGNILFLAPTKPLVEQHARFLKKHLIADEPVVLTGEIPPAKREVLWGSSQIICATPQVISNDLISGQLDLNDLSLIVFDEAHRATGDYAYVFIAERYAKVKDSHVLGMTASPGSNKEKILEVCGNLGIEGVEIRHDYDPDVVRYVHDVRITWKEVSVPRELKKVLDFINDSKKEQLEKLKKLGYMKDSKYASTKDLLATDRDITASLNRGTASPADYEAKSLIAVIMKLNHAQEMAETQGLAALRAYFEKLAKEARAKGASKAAKTAIALPKVQLAMREASQLEAGKLENPKLKKVVEIVKGQLRSHKQSKIIVFTHFRDTSEMVADALEKVEGVRPARFVGQASKGEDKGLKQKEQVELIDRFKDGNVNVLVATSVAEEGLDIPATDMVIFYEPVPSEIRTIQRRGRTGRQRSGKVYILIYKGTRDEAYYWSSRHKESRMHKELEKLRKELRGVMYVGGPRTGDFANLATGKSNGHSGFESIKPQKSLADFESGQDDFVLEQEAELKSGKKKAAKPMKSVYKATPGENISIIVDTREFNSSVVRELARQDFVIDSKQLEIGDYVVSDRLGIERKEVDDFIHSLKDGRLFQQAKALTRAYLNPVMIIEGENLTSRSNLGKDAIYGALASITADFGITVITVRDEKETADFVGTVARREHSEGRLPAMRTDKGIMLDQERQQYIIEGLPNVSAVLAQRLLAHFGSASAVLNADVKELMEVKGIGKGIAQGIREVLDAKYYSKEKND